MLIYCSYKAYSVQKRNLYTGMNYNQLHELRDFLYKCKTFFQESNFDLIHKIITNTIILLTLG